jgi:hypothetical protein
MKPELRQALDEEILKAGPELQTFLNDQYFKDTLSLIERVNKLDAGQAVSLELEITMFLLGISDYPSIEEALRGELGQNGQVANEATVRQAVKDVEAYILSKVPTANDSVKKVEIKTDTETEKSEAEIPTAAGNLHDILYKELDVNKKAESVETKPELDPILEIKPEQITAPEIVEPTKPLDFYREKIGDEDKKVKTL